MEMKFYLMGEYAACMRSEAPLDFSCQQRIWAMATQLKQRADLVDVVPGMNNLAAIFDPQRVGGDELILTMKRLWNASRSAKFPSRKINISVNYGGDGGPDLGLVAEHAGLSPDEVIAAHSAAEYVVYFMGFQPGFAYLGGLSERLITPRRAEPRLSVPAGSVGIGGDQTGIYPSTGPGGWQLIGRTALRLFDPTKAEPILLRAGDVIRFVPATSR